MKDYRHYYNGVFNWDPERIYPLNTIYNDSFYKPNGLWFSVGDSWEKWCLKEKFRLDKIKKYLKININNPNTILVLDEDNIEPFLKQYSYGYHFDEINGRETYKIYWNEVRYQYDGIMINKEDKWLYSYGYKIEAMPFLNFIETWDCLSGVIWNLKGAKVEVDPMPCISELIL